VIVALQGCVIFALQSCVIVAWQGCVARLRDCCSARLHDCCVARFRADLGKIILKVILDQIKFIAKKRSKIRSKRFFFLKK
jgi:hypothetical protein